MRKMHGLRHLYVVIMDLELRHLRCLVAIVDSGTFTDAAIDLGISQAAVSRNLIALEQVLGVRLMHRTSRTITMTTAGVHVLAQARQVLAAADDLVAGRGEYLPCLGEDVHAGGGRGDAAAGAVQQPDAEDLLKRDEVPRYRRLRDAELDGGVGEGASVHNRDQAAQVPQLQIHN